MVWILQAAAVKPFAHFYNEIFMVLNFQESVAMEFAQFYFDILFLIMIL